MANKKEMSEFARRMNVTVEEMENIAFQLGAEIREHDKRFNKA